MSVLTGESRLQQLRVLVHVVLCIIICSCIFHPSSWSCIFRSSIFRQIWSSIFRSYIFHLPTFQLSWSCIFRSLLSYLLFFIGPPFSGPPFQSTLPILPDPSFWVLRNFGLSCFARKKGLTPLFKADNL